MKRSIFITAVVLFAVFLMSNGSSNAVEQRFAERFVVNGSANSEGESGTYNFDRAHSAIGFRVKHMGLVEVPGYFRDFTGTVVYDAKDVSKSTVTFTAKMTSVNTGNDGRDNHLRTADFFEVEKFPEMTFNSTKVVKSGTGLSVTGDLTMKGVTKTVTFPVNVTGFLPATQRSGPRMGATAETTINRRDFGVNYGGNVAGTDIPTLADNVKVWLQIEAVMPLPAKAPAE